MSVSFVLGSQCPYCASVYDDKNPQVAVIIHSDALGGEARSQISCRNCISTIGDVVKRILLSSKNDTILSLPILLRKAIDLSDLSQPQLFKLFEMSDVSDEELYRRILQEIIEKYPSASFAAWEKALLNSLPSIAYEGEDPHRTRCISYAVGTCSEYKREVLEATFHGNKPCLRLILGAIDRYSVAISAEAWVQALLRAGPHCVQFISYTDGSLPTQKYSSGDLEMVSLLLHAIPQGTLLPDTAGYIEFLMLSRGEMKKMVHDIIYVKMCTQEIVDLLYFVAKNVQADPSLILFSDIFLWVRDQKRDLLASISSLFFERFTERSSRYLSILQTVCNMKRDFLFPIGENSLQGAP